MIYFSDHTRDGVNTAQKRSIPYPTPFLVWSGIRNAESEMRNPKCYNVDEVYGLLWINSIRYSKL